MSEEYVKSKEGNSKEEQDERGYQEQYQGRRDDVVDDWKDGRQYANEDDGLRAQRQAHRG